MRSARPTLGAYVAVLGPMARRSVAPVLGQPTIVRSLTSPAAPSPRIAIRANPIL